MDELLTYLLDAPDHPLGPALRHWLALSPRFRAFVEANRSKIRKKIRSRPDIDSLGDLRSELAVAFLLLRDRRCALTYEQYYANKQRGPDFSAVFKGHTRFDVEVTRLRGSGGVQPEAISKIAYNLCNKLGQFQPGMVNLLAIICDQPEYTITEVGMAVRLLYDRSAQRDEPFFAQRGFAGISEFHRQFLRLSTICVWVVDDGGSCTPIGTWNNPQARHKPNNELVALLSK